MKYLFTALSLLLTGSLYAQTTEMAEIPAGNFWMGSNGWGHDFDEAPIHIVTISEGFRMSVTEITNAQYEEFRPEHRELRGKDGFSSGDNEAVVHVSYYDAVAYCKWLSEKTGRDFRLPTEAEWEYACRAGSYTRFWCGDWPTKIMEKNQQTERNLKVVSFVTSFFFFF